MRSDPDMRGVIPNSFDHIFTHIARTQNQQYLVRASYLEIYQVCTKYNITKQSDIHVPVHVIIIWQILVMMSALVFSGHLCGSFCVCVCFAAEVGSWTGGLPFI